MPETKTKEDPTVKLGDVLPKVTQNIKPGEHTPEQKPSSKQTRQPVETSQTEQYHINPASELETRLYEKIISGTPKMIGMYIPDPRILKVNHDSKKLIISVPNKFNIPLIEEGHKSYLLECVSDVLGRGYEIDFKIDLPLFEHLVPIDRVTKPSKPQEKPKQRKLEKKAGMPYGCTFGDVGLYEGNKRALITLRQIYTDITSGRPSLLRDKLIALIGGPGVGKTYDSSALANTLSGKGFGVWYINLNNLATKLHRTKGEFNKKLRPPEGIKLAVFDDIDGCFSETGAPRPGTQRGFLKCLDLVRNSPEKIQIILTGQKEPKDLSRKLRAYASSIKDDEDLRKWVANSLAAKLEGATRIYLDPPSSELRDFVSCLFHPICKSRKELDNFLDFYMGILPEEATIEEIKGDRDTIEMHLKNYGGIRLTPEIAREALRYQQSLFDPKKLPRRIIEVMTDEYGISKEELLAKNRGSKSVADLRHKVVYVLRRLLTDKSTKEIAKIVNRTHATVLSSEKRVIRDHKGKESELEDLVKGVKSKLRSRGVRLK